MLEILFAMITTAAQGYGAAAPDNSLPTTEDLAVTAQTPPVESAQPDPAPPQTGRFTTAQEVKPILEATRGNWVALRQDEQQDAVYVTHLWAWRCGLTSLSIGLNDEPLQAWPLPPCHDTLPNPNAILETDGLPFITLHPSSVQRVVIEVIYDDATSARAEFSRAEIVMP